VLDVPVRPFGVRVPAPPAPKPGNVFTALAYGDSHIPFHDPAALKLVQAVAKDLKPDVLIHMGDLVDAWQISRFDKDPTRNDSLQDNIDEARQHLAEMALVVPKSRRILLEGNHENRLTRLIWGLFGAARELPKLRLFTQHMTWPTLLELDAIGWEWVGDREQTKTSLLPRIIAKHGTVVRKWSGATARGEWEKYGRSGVSGHTHRLGDFLHRDSNGVARWLETGCTCLLDPPYGTDFDWAQGCAVLTWSGDRHVMSAEVLSFREGRVLWRGQEIVVHE
jgi:predicted phosphodiesterase